MSLRMTETTPVKHQSMLILYFSNSSGSVGFFPLSFELLATQSKFAPNSDENIDQKEPRTLSLLSSPTSPIPQKDISWVHNASAWKLLGNLENHRKVENKEDRKIV